MQNTTHPDNRQVIIDFESTGLSRTAKATQFAALEIINYQPKNSYVTFFNPTIPIDAEAARITGLNNDFLKDKPLFKDKVEDILNFIGNSTLVAHNANFDIKLMNYELSLLGRPLLTNKYIDTLNIARSKFPGERVNLDALYKKYFGNAFKREQHDALEDVYMLLKVYQKLIDFESQETFSFKKNKKTLEVKQIVDTKVIKATIDEIKQLELFKNKFFSSK